MLSEIEMTQIAEKFIAAIGVETNKSLLIRPEFTIRKKYGNIYVYNSKRYIETNDFQYALLGNAPFLVENETGKIIQFGTAMPIEYYIKEYEAGRWQTI